VAEQLPFISDRARINVGELYVPAQDHKALAISYSRIGMISGQADVETAKNGALDNCRKALERAGIHNKCELYAVGNTVVFQGGHPPMPPRPWFRSDPSIERLVNSKDVPFVNAGGRSWIEKNYPAARKSKALALSPRGGFHYTVGALSQDESARSALEICGHITGVACMIIAIDDVFVVPIPTMMNAVEFFRTAGNALIAPGSRDNVARRLATGTRGWSAVATGANGLAGVVPDAGSEQSAIEGALADCRGRDHGCHVIAIGPFSVVAAEVGKTP
jgi:adenylate cyclase